MTWPKLWVIAYRDLLRNRRRSFLTLLAVALGLALLILMSGYIAGVVDDALQNSIRLQTGHVQLRAPSYAAEQLSLAWKDLLAEPETLAAQAQALDGVQAATPVLWAGGILNTADETVGLKIYGIDVNSAFYAPIRETLGAGAFLAADDRSGVLMGQRLADSLGLSVDDKVNLTVINANGQPDTASFTLRGLFATGVPTYDENAVFMPLAKAQAFTGANNRASAVVILLQNQDTAEQVAAALATPAVTALTWTQLNQVFLETMATSMSFYVIMDFIVMLIVAVLIANTLLMAVFERVREMGILAALGMKGRQIMGMFLFEAAILALAGIAVGIGLGVAGVIYLATNGIPLGEAAAVADNIALSSTIYTRLEWPAVLSLSAWTLVITLVAALYPAWFAARMEPVKALHAL